MTCIKLRPIEDDPIAHEVVYQPKYVRNSVNCFRFIFMSYLYHRGLKLREILAQQDTLVYTRTYRHLCLTRDSPSTISYDIALQVCNLLGVNLQFLYEVAQTFLKHPEYNAVSFGLNDKAILFKAYLSNFESDEEEQPLPHKEVTEV